MKISIKNINIVKLKTRNHPKRGFTLLEILVVITIISTLSAIGFGTFLKLQENARGKETTIIINAVATAMQSRSNNITSTQRSTAGVNSGETYPIGDGSDGSTTPLINYISGDFDGAGGVDDGVTSELPQVDIDSADNSSFIKQVNSGDDDGGGAWVIVDGWGMSLRYTYNGTSGVHNTYDDGFDLESAGPDNDFDTVEDNIILE